MSRPYRRQRGDRVFYTPQQTAHYKSEHLRWQTGRRLRPSGIVVVSPDVVKYRFPSVRSPAGVWEVTVTRGDATPGGSDGNGEDCWTPAVPAAGAGASLLLMRYTGWYAPQESLGDGDFTSRGGDGFPVFSNGAPPQPTFGNSVEPSVDNFSYQPWTVETSYLLASASPDGFNYQYWWYLEVWAISYTYLNFPTLPPEFSENGNNPLASIVSHTSRGNSYSSSCPYPPGSGGGGTSGDYITYDCNCPDHDKRQGALIRSRYPSEHSLRDWSDSNAGARENCKHIYGTMFARGENPPDPSDRQQDQRPPQRDGNPSDYYDQEEDFLRGLVEGRRQEVSEDVQNYYSDQALYNRQRMLQQQRRQRRERREFLQADSGFGISNGELLLEGQEIEARRQEARDYFDNPAYESDNVSDSF